MSYPGCAISKQELLDHIWGENDAADHNVVQVYVSSLRRKIGLDGDEPMIETVRGIGYRMRDEA
jgi:DNA-binding response OmpR family regulator